LILIDTLHSGSPQNGKIFVPVALDAFHPIGSSGHGLDNIFAQSVALG
jgi:hypothetical protein